MRRSIKRILPLVAFFAVAVPVRVRAQVIARFLESFSAGTNPGVDTADTASLGTGWGYYWNAPNGWAPGGPAGNGATFPVGTRAHYRPLIWAGGTQNWSADGDTTNGNNQPSGFLRLQAMGGGHPGLGSGQTGNVGNSVDRYVVIVYEIQPEDGVEAYAISGSSIRGTTASGTPLRVTIHVNDDPPLLSGSYPKDGVARSFDVPLGNLDVGDRVHVCVGPDGNAGSDSFDQFDFSIGRAVPPEPCPDPPPPPPAGGPPTSITIINPGAEINGGIDRQLVNDPAVPGWRAEAGAQVIRWDTAAGNGDWRYAVEDDDVLYQKTDHVIAPGEAFSLRFDASSFSGLPASVTAELYVEEAAEDRTPIVSRTFAFQPAAVANWQSFQLIAYFGELDAHAGKTVGVQFHAPPTPQDRYFSVDRITLTAYNGVLPSPALAGDWSSTPDRTWIGADFWANRLQDWEVRNGRLECRIANVGKPMRTVHAVTTRLKETPANVTLQVRTGPATAGVVANDACAGFLVGAGQGLDVRAAALVHHNHGKDGGLIAGVDGSGRAVFRDNTRPGQPHLLVGAPPQERPLDVELSLTATYTGPDYCLDLEVIDPTSRDVLSSASLAGVSPVKLIGNVALVSHPGRGGTLARFWFQDWHGSGSKLATRKTRPFGPILSALHTLSDGVLTLTAQMAPFSPGEAAEATLEIDTGVGGWRSIATVPIDPVAHTATFRIGEWDADRRTRYRVRLLLAENGTYFYEGLVRRDPVDRETIVLAGITGMIHVLKSGGGAQGVDTNNPVLWTRDFLIYPHTDLTDAFAAHAPDLLFFSGDQIYEGSSPTRADNSSAANRELDYLYKWFLWCWTFRDLTRDIPTLVIPDDHDVYQGNLWGQGGRPIGKQEQGGYVRPARFVKMVERTQTSNLPESFDPTPVEQGIGVYYCSLRYGRIGLAVIEDRKFKNGFQGQPGMPDPLPSPSQPLADPTVIDPPGLLLLGDRQLTFLETWIEDWRGVDMKAALSQTLFASVPTHTGEGYGRRYFDYDAGGWPPAGRNRAVALVRKAFAPHICGDQHLSLVVRYGLDDFDDASYAFCLPAGVNFFPRVFDPLNRQSGTTTQVNPVLGPFEDGLANKVTVEAVANPASYYQGISTNRSPLSLNDRAAGYGIVRFNKAARTITFENWPRYADPADPSTGGQYEDWPITIRQLDNYDREPVAYLPPIDSGAVVNPVITVIDESNDETVYSLRIAGTQFHPHVFRLGSYTVRITEPDTGFSQTLTGQIAAAGGRPFHRGDANTDGTVNIGDAINVLTYLFQSGDEPTCLETADANNDGAVNIADAIALLGFLFASGEPPADPGPPPAPCGPDPDAPGSAGDLGCERYDRC